MIFDTNMPPRRGPHYDSPGAYELLVKVPTPVINPGDEIKLDVYITGYGMIGACKLATSFSDSVFDAQRSYVVHGLKKKGDTLSWGGKKDTMPDMFIISLEGVHFISQTTLFFDMPNSNGRLPILATETSMGSPPFAFRWTTLAALRPGPYYIEFQLTYFDGKAWRINNKKIEIKVRNFIERHAVKIGVAALLAASLTIANTIIRAGRDIIFSPTISMTSAPGHRADAFSAVPSTQDDRQNTKPLNRLLKYCHPPARS